MRSRVKRAIDKPLVHTKRPSTVLDFFSEAQELLFCPSLCKVNVCLSITWLQKTWTSIIVTNNRLSWYWHIYWTQSCKENTSVKDQEAKSKQVNTASLLLLSSYSVKRSSGARDSACHQDRLSWIIYRSRLRHAVLSMHVTPFHMPFSLPLYIFSCCLGVKHQFSTPVQSIID